MFARVLVLHARVVLGALLVVIIIPAKLAMLLGLLEFFELENTAMVIVVVEPSILEPLLVDLVHALLAVLAVGFESFLLPLEDHVEVVLHFDHVLSVVALAALPAGSPRVLFLLVLDVVRVEGHLAEAIVAVGVGSVVVLVLKLAVASFRRSLSAAVQSVLLFPDIALVLAGLLAVALVVVPGLVSVIGHIFENCGALVLAAAVGLGVHILPAHAGLLGAEAEDREVLRGEDGGGVLRGGDCVVILLHGRAAMVG
mmetsp:Transcript_7154/g.17790  ORF Transcript_7154/g.17790 Transcript_7154/m.17790 type:complete len:255 (+) Transcript_7154:1154-1918(+)